MLDVIAAEDEDLADQLESEVAASVAAVVGDPGAVRPAPARRCARQRPGPRQRARRDRGARGPDPDDRRRRRGARSHDQRHLSGIDGEQNARSRWRPCCSLAACIRFGGLVGRHRSAARRRHDARGRRPQRVRVPRPEADQRRTPPVRDRRQLLHPELGDRSGVDRRPRRAGPDVQRPVVLVVPPARRTRHAGRHRFAASSGCCCGCRSRAPTSTAPRSSIPSTVASSRTAPIVGVPIEGELTIHYTEQPGEYADGTHVLTARSRRTRSRRRTSVRSAPTCCLAAARPAGDRDGTARGGAGVDDRRPRRSRRRRRRRHLGPGQPGLEPATEQTELGRFGWKANVPSVEAQVAGAFHGDIGITSALHPDQDCTAAQTDVRGSHQRRRAGAHRRAAGGVTFYSRTLAVPAMRDTDDRTMSRTGRRRSATSAAPAATPRR